MSVPPFKRPPAVLFTFDGIDVLFDPRLRRAFLLNLTAAAAWRGLVAGWQQEQLTHHLAESCQIPLHRAAEMIRDLIERWRAAGLLEPGEDANAGTAPLSPQKIESAREVAFRLYDRVVRVRCGDEALLANLCAVAGPAMNAGAEPTATLLELAAMRSGFVLMKNGEPIYSARTRARIRWALLRFLMLESGGRDQWCALLHASAVARNGRAVVLAGRSGAGKTTLTAAALVKGLSFLADDIVPIDSGGGVWPVPLAMGIKAAGWPVVEALLPHDADITSVTGSETRFVWPAFRQRQPIGRPCEAVAVIVPSYVPGVSLCVRPLTAGELVSELGATGTLLPDSMVMFSAFLDWIRERKAFAVRYGTLDEATAWIDGVVDAGECRHT